MLLQYVVKHVTTVDLAESTWRELNARKKPGDSFDDVISRLLEEPDEKEEAAHTAHD